MQGGGAYLGNGRQSYIAGGALKRIISMLLRFYSARAAQSQNVASYNVKLSDQKLVSQARPLPPQRLVLPG